jgi:hypothetical protein
MWKFFHGFASGSHQTHQIEWGIFYLVWISRFIVASAAYAELRALFLNCKQTTIFRLTLEEMGHPQPPTSIHCDNLTAVGIVNKTIKRQQSQSMEIHFFWVADAVEQEIFNISNTTLGKKISRTTRVNTT